MMPVPSGQYVLKDGIYMCKPDLTGFHEEVTYFVRWDEEGNEILDNKIYGPEPENWYNYSEKEWANIVTLNNGQVAYWVWIPRYKYKITYYTDASKTTETTEVTEYGTIDVKMVDTNDVYRNPQGQIEELGDDYLLPEGFNFNNKKLAGIWSAKYEVSATTSSVTMLNLELSSTDNSITIENITNTSTVDTSTYQFYINGHKHTGSLPYTFEKLNGQEIYIISVVAKDTSGNYVYSYTKTMQLSKNPKTPPDLTGFNQDTTYYVTWDEDGNEIIGDKISEKAPSNWYNYGQKRWANIVTINNGKMAYWVWIPRYEYKIVAQQGVVANLIDVNKTTPSDGYQIPEGFTFNGKPLAGIWSGKYEVSGDATLTSLQGVTITTTTNSITIESVQNASAIDASSYQIYLNGKKYTGSIPYTFNDLEQNTEYRIDILAKDTSGNYTQVFSKGTSTQITPPYEPDLTGFNPECTYYVTWNKDGEEQRTQITQDAPDGWYDYGQRKWANIVTTGNGKTAYWVWIPRYEYKVVGDQGIMTRFITTEQTTGRNGYQIPEGFTFNGKALKGIWAGKYEVSS